MGLTDAVALALSAPGARQATLSPRERDVHERLLRGDSNKEIAAALRVSPRTVNGHLSNIYRKLGVRGRTEAVATAARSYPL